MQVSNIIVTIISFFMCLSKISNEVNYPLNDLQELSPTSIIILLTRI